MRGLRVCALVVLLLGTWMLGTSAASEQTVILYANHTTGWHVWAAVNDWNANGEVVFVPTSDCTDKPRCVDIWARPGEEQGVLGDAYPAGPNPQVWMSTRYYGLGDRVRRQAVCHELGHVLMVGHNRSGGCMTPIADGKHRRPSADDLAWVREIW